VYDTPVGARTRQMAATRIRDDEQAKRLYATVCAEVVIFEV
jgi:hypothetical protein